MRLHQLTACVQNSPDLDAALAQTSADFGNVQI